MAEVLMFNPNDLAYFFINSAESSKIDKMRSDGFIMNPRLQNMYNPDLKKYVMIPVQNQKEWENKGYYAEPTMIYHPKDGTRMVSHDDAKKALSNGWYSNPAHFPGNSEGRLKTLVLKEAV